MFKFILINLLLLNSLCGRPINYKSDVQSALDSFESRMVPSRELTTKALPLVDLTTESYDNSYKVIKD